MSTIKRIFSLLLSFYMLFSLSFAVFSVSPGPLDGRENAAESEYIKSLRETREGYSFDSLIACVKTRKNGQSSLPVENDPRVKSVVKMNLSFPGDGTEYYLFKLNTSTKEELDGFIDKYEKEEYIARFEKNCFSYIPEEGKAVVVDLKASEPISGGTLGEERVFSPEDFSEEYVERVIMGGEALLPAQLILQLKDPSHSNAAAFALELIDFENSDIFTQRQKETFANSVAGVRLISYDFVSYNDELQEMAETAVIKVWTKSDGEDLKATLIEKKAATESSCCFALDDGKYRSYYIYLRSPTGEELEALTQTLNDMEKEGGVACYSIYSYIDFSDVEEEDSKALTLIENSAKLPGDVNGDGEITSGDARTALRAAVKLEELHGSGIKAADVSGDGRVTAEDAREILRAAVGLVSMDDLRFTAEKGETLYLGPYFWNDGGYEWNLIPEKDGDKIIVESVYTDTSPNIPGSGNPEFFSVKFSEKGSYKLILELKRPWEDKPIEEKIIYINIV